MHFIHYPPGGFGHFILQMASICFDDVFCPQDYSSFDNNGNSHEYPLHVKMWYKSRPFDDKRYYDFGDKIGICLIDSGSHDHKHRDIPNTVRMCIDRDAYSIVMQTCRDKAEQSTSNYKLSEFNFTGEPWEIREHYSLAYHYQDTDGIDAWLQHWKPVEGCTNINVSDLFFNPVKVVRQLEPIYGTCDWKKIHKLWQEFMPANEKYYRAQQLVNQVRHALQSGYDFEFTKEYSLHDQGYLTYWLERQYNIKEIPPYDYRNWFKNTQEIRTCLKLIHSQ